MQHCYFLIYFLASLRFLIICLLMKDNCLVNLFVMYKTCFLVANVYCILSIFNNNANLHLCCEFHCGYCNFAAYYRMTDYNRDIIDNLCVTKGTTINWRMMGTIIRYASNIDQMVVQHDAGDYDQGRVYALLHTINYSNRNKNFVVSVCYYFTVSLKIVCQF